MMTHARLGAARLFGHAALRADGTSIPGTAHRGDTLPSFQTVVAAHLVPATDRWTKGDPCRKSWGESIDLCSALVVQHG